MAYDKGFVQITKLPIYIFVYMCPLSRAPSCTQLPCYLTKIYKLLPHLLKVTSGTWSDGRIDSSSDT